MPWYGVHSNDVPKYRGKIDYYFLHYLLVSFRSLQEAVLGYDSNQYCQNALEELGKSNLAL